MKIDKSVYDDLMNTVPATPPEVGVILGGKGGIVEFYYVDSGLPCGDGCYVPDTDALNAVIDGWCDKGIDLIGFAHTHSVSSKLSAADRLYVKDILKAQQPYHASLLFPVIIPHKCVESYAAEIRGDNIVISEDQIKIIAFKKV